MPLRSTIVGAASGVLLLAGVVGFAVGLPEVTGDEAEASGDAESPAAQAGTPPAELIPETLLDGALVRYPAIDPQMTEVADQVETFGTEKLTDVFEHRRRRRSLRHSRPPGAGSGHHLRR